MVMGMEKAKCIAVVLAAGAGKRMQSNVAKQYLLLEGKPVLWYALHVFEESKIIDEVILVVGKGEIPYCQEEIVDKYGFKKVADVIEGGAERFLSVWEAMKWIRGKEAAMAKMAVRDGQHMAEKSGTKDTQRSDVAGIIFIHDGARPFVTEEILQAAYDAASEHGACVTGMPVKDTIKISDPKGFAVQTPNRKTIWQVQTPQVFDAELIIEAYSELIDGLEQIKEAGIEITDDAMVVEIMKGKAVKLVKGSYENIKITTPEDMKIAQSLLESQQSSAGGNVPLLDYGA